MGRRGKTCADTTELSRLLPSLAPHIQHQTPHRERKPRGLRVPCLRRKPPQRPGASVLGEPHCHSRSAQQLQFHAWLSFPEMCWDVTSGARTRALKIARLMCCQMPACCQLSPPQGSWGVGDMVAQTAASSALGVAARGPRRPGSLARTICHKTSGVLFRQSSRCLLAARLQADGLCSAPAVPSVWAPGASRCLLSGHLKSTGVCPPPALETIHLSSRVSLG